MRADLSTQTSRRWPKVIAVTLPVVLLLAAGGYVAVVAAAPLPEPTLTLTAAESESFSADPATAQAVVDERELPTAIGWLDGQEVWSNDDTPYPLASISKLITVLVCQEAQPLGPGEDGPVYTWTAADRARQDHYVSLDGVAYPIPVGTEVTLREMLTLIFLPSANDFAAAYAYSVFGDNEAFVAAVQDWATRNDFTSLELVEPTGMDEGNRANAADLIRIGRLALNNPTISEFTSTPSADMPWGIGRIENTNPLLNELPGMLGVKTGRSDSAGFNFLAAQKDTAGAREVVKMSVTLARPSIEARAQSGRDMLAAVAGLPAHTTVVTEGEEVASLVGFDGSSVRFVASASAATTLLPGESAHRTVRLTEDAATATTATAATAPGSITIDSPEGSIEVPLSRVGSLPTPDLWWRITHPSALFG